MDEDNKTFPFPLDTDIEEKIPVKTVKFDPETKTVRSVYQMETRITRYMNVPKEKIRCQDGDHIFKCVDGGRGIFSCTECPYSRKVYPSTHKFMAGRLVNKKTGQVV